MTFEELAMWLHQELREGRMQENQVADVLSQRLLFDQNRQLIESEFRLKAVGYIANERQVADSVAVLLNLAAQVSPDRMLYFEPIGYRAF